MLNLWIPFLFNRIQIISISDNFYTIKVKLKFSFWNCNPNKSVWGGSIVSVLDPFFPIMIKQILLREGIMTDFYSKSINVKFIKLVKEDILFLFCLNDEQVNRVMNKL